MTNHRVFLFDGDPNELIQDSEKELGSGHTTDNYFLVPNGGTAFIHALYPYHCIYGKVKEFTDEQLLELDNRKGCPRWHYRHKVPIDYTSVALGRKVRGYCWVYFGHLLAELGPYSGPRTDKVRLGSARFP